MGGTIVPPPPELSVGALVGSLDGAGVASVLDGALDGIAEGEMVGCAVPRSLHTVVWIETWRFSSGNTL